MFTYVLSVGNLTGNITSASSIAELRSTLLLFLYLLFAYIVGMIVLEVVRYYFDVKYLEKLLSTRPEQVAKEYLAMVLEFVKNYESREFRPYEPREIVRQERINRLKSGDRETYMKIILLAVMLYILYVLATTIFHQW